MQSDPGRRWPGRALLPSPKRVADGLSLLSPSEDVTLYDRFSIDPKSEFRYKILTLTMK